MIFFYLALFIVLVVLSAFFSSAETSLLSLNKLKLGNSDEQGRKGKKKKFLQDILKSPEDFFSTILIGNNLVNIAAASVTAYVFTGLCKGDEEFGVLLSTLFTTIVILLFAEVIPKNYAFRYSEKLSFMYAGPIRFFRFLFFPIVKIISVISGVFLRTGDDDSSKELSAEEIKLFLKTETSLLKYNASALKMINEIIDIASKDIKAIMTPRVDVIGLEVNDSVSDLRDLIVKRKLTKIPVYRDNPGNITGVINTNTLVSRLMDNSCDGVEIRNLIEKPFYVSEFSSLNYAYNEFKTNNFNLGVVVDEYGCAIGIVTLNDIFREILGEIDKSDENIRKISENRFLVKGETPVDDLNQQIGADVFTVKKAFTTMSGLYIYYSGVFPEDNSVLRLNRAELRVVKMGNLRIEELEVTVLKQ